MKTTNLPRLLLTDLDGTLTDGYRYMLEDGKEIKRFYVPDGLALLTIKKLGVQIGCITTDTNPVLIHRSKQLKFDVLEMGVFDKLAKGEEICATLGISLKDVAYIGDDINDYKLLSAVGVKACPNNAQKIIQNIPSIFVTKAAGGAGALREFVEHIVGGEEALYHLFERAVKSF